ncbi:MAG TPA: hypothetical protein VM840_09915, partial [Actinomycetota bacterium]|nr:hypothetical protein [Actinomycetota bacterium]
PQTAPPAPRGVHIAWAKLERARPAPSAGVTQTGAAVASPPAPAPAPGVERKAEPEVPAPRTGSRDRGLEEAYDDGTRLNALGRLAAVVVTLGLGWALAFALTIWIIARLVS